MDEPRKEKRLKTVEKRLEFSRLEVGHFDWKSTKIRNTTHSFHYIKKLRKKETPENRITLDNKKIDRETFDVSGKQ